MAKKKKINLDEIFLGLKENGGRTVIFTHPTPDPDAISSAFGIQWLLKSKYDIDAFIYYDGEISHPQNKTMVNYLNVVLHRMEEYKHEEADQIITVDSTESVCNGAEPYLVIDHHRNTTKVSNNIMEQIGANATIIWEMIKESGLELTEDRDINLATALYLGIVTDTQELRSDNSTDRDASAAWELTKILDKKKLDSILDYDIPSYFYELRDVAAMPENSSIRDTCWVSSVDIIPPAKRDVLPMLADDMIRREGISVAVVVAIIGDVLNASVRSKNAAFDVNDFCWKIFGKEYSGSKFGGMGGARVPLGINGFKDLPKDIADEYLKAFKQKLFYQILHVAAGN